MLFILSVAAIALIQKSGFLLSLSVTLQLPQDVPADAGFLHSKAVVLSLTIKERSCMFIFRRAHYLGG